MQDAHEGRFVLVREGGEDDFGDRNGDKGGKCQKEQFPIKRHDDHAKTIGKKSQRQKPEQGVDCEHRGPEFCGHKRIIPYRLMVSGVRLELTT